MILATVLPLTGCRPAASLETLVRPTPMDEYRALLSEKVTSDGRFDFNTLSSALTVRALHYSGDAKTRAALFFEGDPVFAREAGDLIFSMKGKGLERGRFDRPVIILMGLFAPDFDENDVAAAGRFRPKLLRPDGRMISPSAIKCYGRNSAFVRDYFPVFNPWENVFLLQFEPWAAYGDEEKKLEFILERPGGIQTLVLN